MRKRIGLLAGWCFLASAWMDVCQAQHTPAIAFLQAQVDKALLNKQPPNLPVHDTAYARRSGGAFHLIRQYGPGGMPEARRRACTYIRCLSKAARSREGWRYSGNEWDGR